jgi:sialate O-acetylesterase
MVLQRDIPIKVWGWADKKERITIAFLGDTITVKADKKGNWQAEFKSIPGRRAL